MADLISRQFILPAELYWLRSTAIRTNIWRPSHTCIPITYLPI